ncbi:hypothetical protein PIB30_092466, partial [Stylosanthes scabra]|nr:hypothetical protein [Stylosanthes scabra]
KNILPPSNHQQHERHYTTNLETPSHQRRATLEDFCKGGTKGCCKVHIAQHHVGLQAKVHRIPAAKLQ